LNSSLNTHVYLPLQGIFCEHSCPRGTEDDVIAIRGDHNIIKFPDSRYSEAVDGLMQEMICSGHGICDDKGDCDCDEYVPEFSLQRV